MSIKSFINTLENDAKKFENVIVSDEQKMATWAENVFGKDKVDAAISNVEAAAQTELGALTKKAVIFAESSLASAAGTARSSAVLSFVSSAASALGIPFSTPAINLLIEMFAPWVEHKIDAELQKVLQPGK